MEDNYQKLLDEAWKNLPEKVLKEERFEVPKADVVIAGNRTLIRNFSEIATMLNRKPVHIMKYLLKELATSGEIVGNKAEFQGKFGTGIINLKIELYTKNYVLCHECGKPDTTIIKEGRVYLLKCGACGARHPIKRI
ncbi:MAG: translation initiation factor IF-2 subunit beta [Candidatus Cloacimonas sp. 4484_209]|nr:translation initiation factor IF-2 subunit beta [Methanomicrobia archaeon]OQX50539.1 MAG: translation initiation factor IF-2 subunit beta [Candidatus Cloacimonas sp. 4484_209]RLF95241.1 MAG: translation initiation factor IF-2 subunit beta [Thermococci archaeon]RLF96501.1 MAG: translation initiation factor IF-2 subunit beta [Thermococci archaeon]RLG01293.1 MAG: translation initiation factor IF-2 subunit beta [Thermococci archaeon]